MTIDDMKDIKLALSLHEGICYLGGKKTQFRDVVNKLNNEILTADEIEQLTNLYNSFIDNRLVNLQKEFDIARKNIKD